MKIHLALNNRQRLICHKTKTNKNTNELITNKILTPIHTPTQELNKLVHY